MGTVFRVHHRGWGLDLAVKCPQAKLLSAAGGREAFEREAETWVNLELHPHIVTCYYVRRIDGLPAVFAEFVDGGSLKEAIAKGSVRSLEQTLDLAIQIAWGLDAAHTAHLVHRDVKPANVMLSADGVAKVTDFGLAVARPRAVAGSGDHSIPAPGGGGGTPAYCSPEQAAGTPLGRRTDIYSWAACVVEMLRGERTWEYGPAVGEALADMHAQSSFAVEAPPERLMSLLGSCLAVDVTERPPDLATVAEQLAKVYEQATGARYGRARPKVGRRRADTLNNRAVSLMDLGRGGDAEAFWERSLEIAPSHPESTYNLACERWLGGRLSDDAFEQSVMRLDRTHATLALKTRVQLALGNLELAREVVADSGELELDADATIALIALAVAREDDPGAVASAEQRLAEMSTQQRRDPRLAAACRALASLRSATGIDRAAAATAGLTTTRRVLATGATLSAVTTTPSYVVAASGNRLVCWRHEAPDQRRNLGEIGERVRNLAGIKDDTVLVASDGAPLLRLDLSTGRTQPAAPHLPGYVMSIATTANGERVVAGSSDRHLRVIDTTSARCLFEIEAHHDSLAAVAIARDGRLGISGGRDARLCTWDLEKGSCLREIDTDGVPVDVLAVSRSGELVATAGADGTVRLWATRTGESAGRLAGHGSQVLDLAIDGEHFLISAGLDRRVRAWDLTAGRVHAVWIGDAPVRSVSTHANEVIAAAGARVVRLGLLGRAPVELAKALSTPLSSEKASDQEAAYRQHIAAARRLGQRSQWHEAAERIEAARAVPGFERDSAAIELWGDLVRRYPRAELRSAWLLQGQDLPSTPATAVASGSTTIHVGHHDGTVTAWGPRLSASRQCLAGHTAPVTAVRVVQSWTVSASLDGTLRVWDARTGASMAVFDGHSDQVLCLTTDPHSSRAASGSADASAIVWGLPDQGWVQTLAGHEGAVTSVAFTADGGRLVTVGWDGLVRIWEVTDGRELARWRAHDGAITAVCVPPDNRSIVTAAADGVISLWEPHTRRRVRRMQGHRDTVTTLQTTPDCRFLISSSRDGTIRTWNLRTGTCVHTLTAHPAGAVAAALDSSATRLITAGGDGAVHLWQLDWQPELHPATRWHEAARPFIEVYLARREQTASNMAHSDSATQLGDAEMGQLMDELARHGFGWLEPAGIEARLASLSASAVSSVPGSAVRSGGRNAPLPRRLPAWRRWLATHPGLAVALVTAAVGLITLVAIPFFSNPVRLYERELDEVRYEQRGFYFRLQPFAATNYRCSSNTVESYIAQLDAPDFENPHVYERAVTCLMQVRDPAIVGEIVQLVMEWTETSARTPRSVPTTISDLAGICAARHTAAIPELAPLVTDERRSVRVLAISALAMIAHERAGETLRAALTSPDSEIRGDAARHLRTAIGTGALEPADGLDVVLGLLEDPEPATRRWAVQALPLFSEPEALAAARAATTDEDEGVAHAAEQALRRLEENQRLTRPR